MELVMVISGKYSTGRDTFREISNVLFPVIDSAIANNEKGPYIVVDGTPVRGYPKRAFKVFVESSTSFELRTGASITADIGTAVNTFRGPVTKAPPVDALSFFETLNGDDDDIVKARIQERFSAMTYLVQTAADGDIRGVVISGPPGVGKTWGVRYALQASLEHKTIQNRLTWEPAFIGDEPPNSEYEKAINKELADVRFKFISGHVTPGALYEILFAASDERSVLVFDDCDSVLLDEDSLNFLKKALDTTAPTRILEYHSTGSRINAPDRFIFKGSIVFISNINFESPKRSMSSIGVHLDAIMSRVYYVDLAMNTLREKYLRIEQVCRDNDLLVDIGLKPEQVDEVMVFFKKNIMNFREVSIRTVEKIGKLALINSNWLRTAEITLFRTLAIIDRERAEAREQDTIAESKSAADELLAHFK